MKKKVTRKQIYRIVFQKIKAIQKKNSNIDFSKYPFLYDRLTRNMLHIYRGLLVEYTSNDYEYKVIDNKIYKKMSQAKISAHVKKNIQAVNISLKGLSTIGLIERVLINKNNQIYTIAKKDKRNGGHHWIYIPKLTQKFLKKLNKISKELKKDNIRRYPTYEELQFNRGNIEAGKIYAGVRRSPEIGKDILMNVCNSAVKSIKYHKNIKFSHLIYSVKTFDKGLKKYSNNTIRVMLKNSSSNIEKRTGTKLKRVTKAESIFLSNINCRCKAFINLDIIKKAKKIAKSKKRRKKRKP